MKYRVTILVVLVLLLLSSLTFASEDTDSLTRAIRNNSNVSELIGTENNVIKLSRDMFDIARYVVITVLVVSFFKLFVDFQFAADAPETRARIKSKLFWISFGIVFVMNFWALWGEASRIASKLFN